MPHSAQPRHTNRWAPRTQKRHQQEHRPQRPTERSDPTQHAKGRTGDCPGPRKGTTTRRNVTREGGGHGALKRENARLRGSAKCIASRRSQVCRRAASPWAASDVCSSHVPRNRQESPNFCSEKAFANPRREPHRLCAAAAPVPVPLTLCPPEGSEGLARAMPYGAPGPRPGHHVPTRSHAPEAVRQAVGGGCRSGWGRLLSVTNATQAGIWRQGDSGWA